MRWHHGILFASLLASSAVATPLDTQTINEAQLHLPLPAGARINPVLIKAQVLLDRAYFSPGEIDGKYGENFKKALRGFAAAQGLRSTGELTNEIWQKLTSTSAEPVLTRYTITNDDVRERLGDCKLHCSGSSEVDNQFKFRRRLHWKVARAFTS